MVCPSLGCAKTSTFPMSTSPSTHLVVTLWAPSDVHLLTQLCFHKSPHALDGCFIYKTVQTLCFEQQSDYTCMCSVLVRCQDPHLFVFLKMWNTQLRNVKVKCSSLAGEFETEVNEYLSDIHKAMSYSYPTVGAMNWAYWVKVKHGNVMRGFAELSTPKSSHCLLGDPSSLVQSL